jgi:hypothetical protein
VSIGTLAKIRISRRRRNRSRRSVRFTPLSFMTKEKTVKPYETVKTQGEYLIWSSNEEVIGLGLKYLITTLKKLVSIRLPI